MEKWVVISKKADFAGIGKRFGIDPVTARVIRNRGMVTEEEIQSYLRGTAADLPNPHLLKDADLLVDILLEKIDRQLPIRIIGDYDIDGVMSSYILQKAMARAGAQVSVQIPDRIADGYGLNAHLITQAHGDGIDTILTCDNGIAAIEEIALAKSLGMTVLVTDHHEVPVERVTEPGGKTFAAPTGQPGGAADTGVTERRSAADAIVNPHQRDCPYPNKHLCGAAVAWKVVCILYERLGIAQEEADVFLEHVAFATVGDIVSLTGENRILVKEGLRRIHHTTNTGLSALIAQCGIEPGQVEAYHFGYVLGPCINASGRLDTAQRALRLLLSDDTAEAVQLANELVVLNEERKAMTQEGVEEAKRVYEEDGYARDAVLVLYLPGVHESIAGIIAGRIRELYYKPTFILTDGAEGVKGSGRSTEAYSMYEELCKCEHLLTKFGGHPMAAGMSLERRNVDELRRLLNANCTLTEEQQTPKIRIDVPMPVDYVTADLVREFGLLAPFGKDNEPPVFADRDLRIRRMWLVGKKKNVLRLSLVTAGGKPASGIFFGEVERFLGFLAERFGESAVEQAYAGRDNPIRFSAVYRPKIDTYRGEESLVFELRNYC
jgi:single-stranded-DNA-specific exonuclease